MSRFLPADHSQGDETTVGGYEAVHGRPAAFDGPDGVPYSIARLADPLAADPRGAFGAYLMFLRWRRVGEEGVEGHYETEFLEFGGTHAEALDRLGQWPIARAQDELAALLADAERPPLRLVDDDEDDE